MKNFIITIQIISLVLIIVSVALQQKGTGLSGLYGGSSTYYQTRRGAEKLVFYVTIAAAMVFLLTTLWQIFAK